MVRIRTAPQRTQTFRPIRARRSVTTQQTQRRSLVEVRRDQAQKEQQQKQYLTSLKNNISNYFYNVDLNNISSIRSQFISANSQRVPAQFRVQFNNYVNDAIKNEQKKQTNTISNISNDIERFKRMQKSYRQRLEKTSSYTAKARYREKLNGYKEKERAGREVLQKLQQGKRFEKSDIDRYIVARGRQEERSTKQLVSKALSQQKNIEINTYIQRKTTIPELSTLKRNSFQFIDYNSFLFFSFVKYLFYIKLIWVFKDVVTN